MPTRQISSQSFDEILSDLGDDPAIPDPHGIRKNQMHHSPPISQSSAPIKSKRALLSEIPFQLQAKNGGIFLALGVLIVAFSMGIFFVLEAYKVDSQASLDGLQNQISALKNELFIAQENWENGQDELYEILDEIEVSIHSNTSSNTNKAARPTTLYPYEADLLRWRYLGVTQIGAFEQVFFYSGKSTVMFKKEDLVLGEWRLSQVQKEAATLSHPKGKSINLKASKSE